MERKLSIHGDPNSLQFKRRLRQVSQQLDQQFNRVSHRVTRRGDLEYHTYRVSGQRLAQLGGGIYFTYQPNMSDMSCYIIAHLKNTQDPSGLWNFARWTHQRIKPLIGRMDPPHITLYECHFNCDVLQCPPDVNPQWITELVTQLIPPTVELTKQLSYDLNPPPERYGIMGKRADNKYLALMLQSTDPNDGMDQYRQQLLSIMIYFFSLDDQPLQMSSQNGPDFGVLIDQSHNEVIAVPDYHINRFRPHISLGALNQPTQPFPFNLLDYQNVPNTYYLSDIDYIEISFKNVRNHFFYHYVCVINQGIIQQYPDTEYKQFVPELDIIF